MGIYEGFKIIGFGMIHGGYILQPRCFEGSEAAKLPPVTREIWFYILRNVNHSSNGKFDRGQNFFNYSKIQDDLCWYSGYRKNTYSKPQITKSIRRLREGNMVETTKATRGLIITVCNFSYYQDPKNYEGNYEGNAKETRRKREGRTINKNDKNVRMEEDKNHMSEPEVQTFDFSTFEGRMIKKIIDSIQELDINCKVPETQKQLKSWAVHVDRLKRLDGRTEEQIEFVVNWISDHHFWKKNIRSSAKLRIKFDDLVAQIQSEKSKPKTTSQKRLEHNNQVGHDFIKEMLQEAEDEKRQR